MGRIAPQHWFRTEKPAAHRALSWQIVAAKTIVPLFGDGTCNLIKDVLGWLFGDGLHVTSLVAIFGYLSVSSPYGKLWKNDTDRKRVIGKLMQDGWRPLYTRTMRPLLDRIDRALSADELDRDLGPARIAWSHDLVPWAMLAAIAYPVLSFVSQWAIAGPLVLAGERLVPSGEGRALAYLWLWLAGCILLTTLLAKRTRSSPIFLAVLIGSILGGFVFSERFGVPEHVGVSALVIPAIVMSLTQGTKGKVSPAEVLVMGDHWFLRLRLRVRSQPPSTAYSATPSSSNGRRRLFSC